MTYKLKLALYRLLSLFRKDPLVVALRDGWWVFTDHGQTGRVRAVAGGMGETALTRIQAGIETTRGASVTATRKVYGMLTPKRDQPRKYAIEDRGIFPEKMRANARLVDASFSVKADVTPEDFPYWLDIVLKGGMAATQIGTSGVYQWVCVPDQGSDTLKSRTLEWGDDSLSYRGAFAIGDQLDIAIPLDDALGMTVNGFVEEWVPTGNEGFTGFTGGQVDRNVESLIGWQQRLFIDPAATIGTTQVSNRFVSGSLTFKNQNKRKWFGDGSPRFTLLGRGRRQVAAQITAEAFDLNIIGDAFNTAINKQTNNLPVERAVRIMLIGSPVASVGTSTAGLTGTVTTIPVSALPAALPAGMAVSVGGVPFVVGPAGAGSGAVAIPVVSQAVVGTIAAGTVSGCKQVMFDYYGYWAGTPNWGTRDTNRTFQLTLDAVYDSTQAKECVITVQNGLPTASGIS